MIQKRFHNCAFTVALFAAAATVSALFQTGTAFAATGHTIAQPAGQNVGAETSSPSVQDVNGQIESGKRIQVMIELDMEPVAQVYANQAVNAAGVDQVAAATQAHLASVEEAQLALLSTLDALDAEVIFRVQRVYNGVAATVAPDQVEALRSTPGVVAVHTLVPQSPDHTRSVPFINAPAIWSGTHGIPATGENMTIAIIDTGIDYLHANFGGSRGYENNDPTIIGDVPGFPGPKVIAGYDFAGDSYNADPESLNYNPLPQPDPDPMDCYGHGTHVAGTAAGIGIAPQYAPVSFGGPYDETTFEQPFTIGPGVAPAAKLIALKVFGCHGSSNLTASAIEWAVDPNRDGDFSDHVDVINMSLGSSYGSLTDPTVIASDNAALIGVVVVASAGNQGDVFFVTGSPASSARAISVAAVRDHLSDGAQGVAASFTSRGPRLGDAGLKPDISAPGEAIVSARSGAPGVESRQLSGTSMAAPHVAGAMALLREIYPHWRVEELKALVMNTARLQSVTVTQSDELVYPYGPTRTGSGVIDLANALNTDVIAFNGDNQGAVGISFGTPEVVDSVVKVKNLRILNKGADPTTYRLTVHTTVDTAGVSFALERDSVTVPAGGYANVPIFMSATAADLRHTGSAKVDDSLISHPHWLSEESGQVLLWPQDGLFRADLSADNDSGLSGSEAIFRYDPQTMTLGYTIRLADFAPEQIVTIQLQSGPSANGSDGVYIIDIPEDWTDPTQPITGVVTLDEWDQPFLVSGGLHLRITTAKIGALALDSQLIATPAVLHVPLYAAPEPASDMRAAESTLVFGYGEDAIRTIHLLGNDIVAQNGPADYSSLISGFELQYSSLSRLNDSASAFADLHYVGISDNLGAIPSESVGDAKIYFGIATHGDWSTPNQVAFDIYIDADEDGRYDYRLFNANSLGYNGSHQVSDTFVAVVENLATETYSKLQLLNDRSSHEADTNPFNTNIMVLPVDAVDIGLTDANSGFSYQIHSANMVSGAFVEATPILHYDLTDKMIDLFNFNESAPILDDHNGSVINVRLDTDNVTGNGESPSLLLLHHRNSSGNRVEVIETRYEWPHVIYFPYFPTGARE